MKRYDHFCSYDGGGPAEAVETPDGDWVRHEDAIAAVASERKRRHALAADLQEYLYRVASQVPMEHAEWAQQRGAALLAALS